MRLNYDTADWVVSCGDKEFYLSDEQMEIIKKASLVGKRLVWFEDFAISILHIAFAERVRRSLPPSVDSLPKLPKGYWDEDKAGEVKQSLRKISIER
jgi:hypothetical protein